jgi:hypothetical protein
MYESNFSDFEQGQDESDLRPPPYSRPVAPPAGFKPPAVKPPAATGQRGLGAIPSLAQSFKNAVIKPALNGMRSITQSQPAQSSVEQQKLLQQGFKAPPLNYVAPGGSPPANIWAKETADSTEYRIPGVKGAATFQGQRKGGGSFTVAATRTPEEQQAINQSVAGINSQTDALRQLNGRPTLAEEVQQQARERDLQQLQGWLKQFAPEPSDFSEQRSALMAQLERDKAITGFGNRKRRESAIAATSAALADLQRQEAAQQALYAARMGLAKEYFGGLLDREQQAQQAQSKQLNSDREYALAEDKLDFDKLNAEQKQKLSQQWLEFQQWRATEKDKLPRSDRRSFPKPAYQSPP